MPQELRLHLVFSKNVPLMKKSVCFDNIIAIFAVIYSLECNVRLSFTCIRMNYKKLVLALAVATLLSGGLYQEIILGHRMSLLEVSIKRISRPVF